MRTLIGGLATVPLDVGVPGLVMVIGLTTNGGAMVVCVDIGR